MTYEEKRSKVIDMVDDLYGDSGMAVLNMMTDYISSEDWVNLYDRLERDGAFKEKEDDSSPAMKEALDYVREQLAADELAEIRAQVDRSYRYHMNPSDCVTRDTMVMDLLEEYGQENGLPEGWWMEQGDIDDILLKL